MREILKESFEVIKQKWQLHILMYLVGLLLTGFPTFLFYEILTKELGTTMLLNELVPDFSFMILGDFLNASGKAFKPVFWYSLGVGFLGSIVYTFFAGGIIDQLAKTKERFSFGQFFKKSAALFPKYFGLLNLIGILLFVFFLVAGLFYFIFVSIADGGTERDYVLWFIPPTILFFVMMTYGLTLSFYAKVFIWKEPKIGFVKAFWEAFYYVYREKKPVIIFWSLMVLGASFLLIYILLDRFIGMRSAFTIALMVFFQQWFILSKFVLKHWNYAAAIKYFERNEINLSQYVKLPEPIIEEVAPMDIAPMDIAPMDIAPMDIATTEVASSKLESNNNDSLDSNPSNSMNVDSDLHKDDTKLS
jgi:hypothetical protein